MFDTLLEINDGNDHLSDPLEKGESAYDDMEAGITDREDGLIKELHATFQNYSPPSILPHEEIPEIYRYADNDPQIDKEAFSREVLLGNLYHAEDLEAKTETFEIEPIKTDADVYTHKMSAIETSYARDTDNTAFRIQPKEVTQQVILTPRKISFRDRMQELLNDTCDFLGLGRPFIW